MKAKTKKQTLYRKITPKGKMKLWKSLDIFAAVAPIIVLGIINWKEYFTTKSTFSNMIGIICLAIFITIILSKKTNFLKGVWGFLLLSLILEFLSEILNDIRLISWFATIGMAISHFWTHPKFIKWNKIADLTENAEINAEAMGNVIEKVAVRRSGKI